MQPSSSKAAITRSDKSTIAAMAASMREGIDTESALTPLYGEDTVARLGKLASEQARKQEGSAAEARKGDLVH